MTEFAEAVMAKLEDIRRAAIIGSKETLNLEECSMLTGLSAQTLYLFTSRREIPHYKRGRTLYFSKKEIEKWMTEYPVKTNDQIRKEAETIISIKKLNKTKKQ